MQYLRFYLSIGRHLALIAAPCTIRTLTDRYWPWCYRQVQVHTQAKMGEDAKEMFVCPFSYQLNLHAFHSLNDRLSTWCLVLL